jgi:hypothetical protein
VLPAHCSESIIVVIAVSPQQGEKPNQPTSIVGEAPWSLVALKQPAPRGHAGTAGGNLNARTIPLTIH